MYDFKCKYDMWSRSTGLKYRVKVIAYKTLYKIYPAY